MGSLDAAAAGIVASTDDAVALAGAVGVELLQRGTFALDPSGRVGTFELDGNGVTNLSVQLGLTRY